MPLTAALNACVRYFRILRFRAVLAVCFSLSSLINVIFSCYVENTLIIACSIQIKDISLYQQIKTTTL